MLNRLRRALGLDRESILIRRMRHDTPAKAQAAILALARLPCSDAIIHALEHSARAHWCVEALGLIADPRASAVLVRKLRRNWVDDGKAACAALCHPRHDPAVPALEALALGEDDYHVVAAAVKALEGIGTARAIEALSRFRAQPSRQLKYYETTEYTLVDSSKLGQGVRT